ncbi:DUF6172 family protein [Thiomicrorhabdus sp.]|uniref:DUF6172 family protein n=1 Tax=Thiomicrorhabdus sp. TaxID=2039724 RepID=UPI002AA83C4B|nr:DUF6172 family protein [Thiomicrorhabdus sp.]
MKKTFKLTHEKIQPARLADAIKSEVKKYIKRERSKALPKGSDFWAFDCKYGINEAESTEIHEAEIGQYIDKALAENLETFYLEVIARPANRTKKPAELKAQELEDEFDEEFDDEFDYDQD